MINSRKKNKINLKKYGLYIWVLSLFFIFPAALLANNNPPSDLIDAVQGYVKKKGLTEKPVFSYALTDLNNDGLNDAVVLLTGSYWCGSGGCNMLIFKGTGKKFIFISGSSVTQSPIRISLEKTHGWSVLIVYSKGKGDVLMRFNGKKYPLNPSVQPIAKQKDLNESRIILE